MKTTVSRIKDARYYEDSHLLARRWCEQAAVDGGSFSILHEYCQRIGSITVYTINWPEKIEAEDAKNGRRYRALVEAGNAHITGRPKTAQQQAVHDAVFQLWDKSEIEALGAAIDAAIAATPSRGGES